MRTPVKVLFLLFAFAVVISGLSQYFPHPKTVAKAPSLNQLAEQAATDHPYIPQTAAQKRQTEADQRRSDAQWEKENEPLRIAYAKFTDDNLNRAGYDVDVTAYGPKHKYLKLNWVLANKPLAFKFSEDNAEMFSTMKKQGFTLFEITDGYKFRWQWDLTK